MTTLSPDQQEHFFTVTNEFLETLHDALIAEDQEKIAELVSSLHAADLADLINKAPKSDRLALIIALAEKFDPDVLPYLDEQVQEEVFELLGRDRFASLLPNLESDDVVEIIEDLEEEERQEVLQAMPAQERAILEQSLHFPEYSAGRLMQREMVVVPLHWNVGQVIELLRSGEDLPDDFYMIFVIDPKFHPVGVLSLSRLLRSQREILVADIMDKKFWPIPVDMDQEEVAGLFRKYGLVSAPVISQSERLIGVITVDDVVDVIDEEAEEDIMHLGGVSEQDTKSAIFETLKMRLPWLGVNLCTAFISSFVISRFTNTISHLVELAVLMSIVPSLSGNAGTQTLTVVVRGLATREISSLNSKRVLRKEILIGIANGIFFAILTGAVAVLWFQHLNLGITIACAMIGNLLLAGFVGALIPMILEKIKVDPAVGSSVVLTALTDSIGFLLFLGLASLFLL